MKTKTKIAFIINILLTVLLTIILIKYVPNVKLDSEYRDLILLCSSQFLYLIKVLLFMKIIKILENLEKVNEYTTKFNVVFMACILMIDNSNASFATVMLITAIVEFVVILQFMINVIRTKKIEV